jgi:hypothetical protein
MNAANVLYALRAGETLAMTGRADPETEALLTKLYEAGVLLAEPHGNALYLRLKRREPPKPPYRWAVVEIVEATWYGVRITRQLVRVAV